MPKKGEKYKIEGRYYNANGFAVAIVASITVEVDWAAYIGATFTHQFGISIPEGQTVQYVATHGCKLREQDARYYFPDLKHLPYRP